MSRVEQIGDCTLYLGDAAEIAGGLMYDALVSDPPYPNNAGHFLDGIDAARSVIAGCRAPHALIFWHERETPPCALPWVALHIWHRTNTNRPDNYEAIFEFHADGKSRASRVLPYCVIAVGLTGIEASGHPTEKHVGLMRELVKRTTGTVLDPFCGSGSTGVACVRMQRPFIGIEQDERWFDIACRRIEAAYRQSDLFIAPPAAKPVQQAMELT
jgi:hypothetical protein